MDIQRCDADLAVNKHGTVACGKCNVAGSGNTETLQIYYNNRPFRMRWLLLFGLCCDENV
jgi:hypothetical protein